MKINDSVIKIKNTTSTFVFSNVFVSDLKQVFVHKDINSSHQKQSGEFLKQGTEFPQSLQ